VNSVQLYDIYQVGKIESQEPVQATFLNWAFPLYGYEKKGVLGKLLHCTMAYQRNDSSEKLSP